MAKTTEIETPDPFTPSALLQLTGHTMSGILDTVLAGLTPPDPEIGRLWLLGHSRSEIAEHVGRTQAAVRYTIDRIRGRLRKLLPGDYRR